MSKKKKISLDMEGKGVLILATWICLFFSTTFIFEDVESLALSHYDLEGANETCDGRASCKTNTRDPRVVDDLDWLDRNCLCDKLCAKYGDCCVDSPYFLAAEQRRGAASFTCVDLRQFGGIYMVTTCPPRKGSMNMRKKCEVMDQSDPLSTLPVTSHKTGITYRNAQCALCHGDLNDTYLDFWEPRLECPSLLPPLIRQSPKNLTDYLRWNNKRQTWGLDLDRWHDCIIDPVLPETSTHVVRRCQADTVYTCAVNWTNSEVRNRCEAYTSLVYEGTVPYRNPHCAMCNNIPLQSLACFKSGLRSSYNKDFFPNAFAILFDLSGHPDGAVGKIKPCLDNQLYDPFFKECRDVLCPHNGEFYQGKCVVEEDLSDEDGIYFPDDNDHIQHPNADSNSQQELNRSGEFNYNVSHFDICPKFLLDPEDYNYSDDSNTTIYISAYDKVFNEDEYRINSDQSLEICAGTLGTRLVNKFGQYMGYITAVGLGVSIFFLVLHLIAFFLVPELQNLSGKNLASLCLALLLAYSSFIAGQCISPGTDSCIASAIITHYAFLASFFWMLTMAFDIWRTLKLATFELRVSSGKQWKKFAYYSIWSWIAPAIIVVAATGTDFAPTGTVNIYLRPLYGVHACWFGHRQALLLFFAAPLALIMILNIIFFSSSAHMVFSTTSTTRYTASGSTQRDFRLYIRLALVMGLTWITGLLAGYLDIEILWYAFIALNTLQGLFIFLAFTCTEKVVRGIKENVLHKWDEKDLTEIKERRPPSFSWSGGSSDTTNKSNLGSSSDESGRPKNYEMKYNYDSAPRSKAFQDRLQNEYEPGLRKNHLETPPNTITSISKMYDMNTKIGYETNLRNGKSFDVFPPVSYAQNGYISYGTNPKINPIYGSTRKDVKNTTFDRRHLDDTLY